MAAKFSRVLAIVMTICIFVFAQGATPTNSIRYDLSAQPLIENYSLAEAIDHIEALPEFAAETFELPDDFKARGANCNSFINQDSSLGRHGVTVRNAFLLNTHPEHIQLLLSDAAGSAYSMPELCPNYKKFDGETRIRFWVWTLASIAWEESTCKDNAVNRGGTNDTAVGLLQLEKTKAKRYWRGPLCNVPEVASPVANLNCGLEIMRGQFDGTYGRPAGLSMPNSYWQRLRAKWSKIDYLISLFPSCG